MKMDIYAEMYLWNRGVDGLIRVLERSEAFSICSRQRMDAFATGLEEIRAGFNADFADATAKRERANESRLHRQRTDCGQQPLH